MADYRHEEAVGTVMNMIAHIELKAAAARARYHGPADDTITGDDYTQVVNRLDGMADGLKPGKDTYEAAIDYLRERARNAAMSGGS